MKKYLVINSAYEHHKVGIFNAKTPEEAKRKFVYRTFELCKKYSDCLGYYLYAFHHCEWDEEVDIDKAVEEYLTDLNTKHYTIAIELTQDEGTVTCPFDKELRKSVAKFE